MVLSAISWGLTGIIVACLLIAVATDLAHRTIPNRLVLVVLACSLVLRVLDGASPLVASVICSVAVLVGLGITASYNLLGWGDVKLIAAVTIAMPVDRVINLLLAITIAGGVLGCLYLAIRFGLRRAGPKALDANPSRAGLFGLRQLARQEATRILANEPMPYAIAVFGGLAYGLATE